MPHKIPSFLFLKHQGAFIPVTAIANTILNHQITSNRKESSVLCSVVDKRRGHRLTLGCGDFHLLFVTTATVQQWCAMDFLGRGGGRSDMAWQVRLKRVGSVVVKVMGIFYDYSRVDFACVIMVLILDIIVYSRYNGFHVMIMTMITVTPGY